MLNGVNTDTNSSVFITTLNFLILNNGCFHTAQTCIIAQYFFFSTRRSINPGMRISYCI